MAQQPQARTTFVLSDEEYEKLRQGGTTANVTAPTDLTPESIFGPVGQWLQTNVQPKMEQAAQAIKGLTQSAPNVPRSATSLLGGMIGGGIQTLAHPVENAETIAPLALELARAFNPVSRGMTAVSLLRGARPATPFMRSAVAVGQGAERAALAGAAGAVVNAADKGEPIGPAMVTGALRQGGADLVFGGGVAGLGQASRAIGRSAGLRALKLSNSDLAELWLKEGKSVDEFNPRRAKQLVKDVMLERAPGAVGGDEYFSALRQDAITQRGARRDMLDSTRTVDPATGDVTDIGDYAVNLRDIQRPAFQLANDLSGPTGGFAPARAGRAARRAGEDVLEGRRGVGLEDQEAVRAAERAVNAAASAPPTPTGLLDASGSPILKFSEDDLKAAQQSLAQARQTAQDNFNARWTPGTEPTNPKDIPVGMSDAAAILREFDKELNAARKKFMTSVGGAGEFVPTPAQSAQQAMRDALNDAINAKAPKVHWQGKDYDYDEFRNLFSRTIVWRDVARRAVGSGGDNARLRGGVTIAGRPFANIGENILGSSTAGYLSRPMITKGEAMMRQAPRVTPTARLAALLALNQPTSERTMENVNLSGFRR